MITLTKSEAIAYDELAIAATKARRNPANTAAKGNLLLLEDEIQQQVGALLHEQVCASGEYAELVRVNDMMYQAIERLEREGPWESGLLLINGPTGLNHQRWTAKRGLQVKWFASKLSEQKFGVGGER